MFIRVIPVGKIQQQILDAVQAELQDRLDARCRLMDKQDVPNESYNQWRKQYNAEVVMNTISRSLSGKFIDKNIPTLILTDADLYYSGLNFVFGLEDPEKSTAIVSIARLKPEFYKERPDAKKLLERTVKEVIHEIGHYLGLDHCHNNYCVMCFSPSVQDVDIKDKNFCKECKIKMMTKGISTE
jgi:archaemetzincin